MVGANSYELRYAFNLGGGLVSERDPSGRVVTYGYDAAGRLLSAGSGSTAYASGMAYKPFGGLESMTLGNGVAYSIAYDEKRLQLSGLTLTHGANVLQKYEYEYGVVNMATGEVDETKNNGQIARIESTVGAQRLWQQRFKYDTLGRLESAGEYYGSTLQSHTYVLNYEYDVYGNRKQKAADNPNNQVTKVWVGDGAYSVTTNRFTSSSMKYDEAGNVIEDGLFRQRKYEYDANNRQRRSAKLEESNGVQSVYDGAGQRVATVAVATGQVTRVMVYDAAGDLVAEYGGIVFTNGTQYVMSDQQGSTRLTMASAPVGGQLVLGRQDYLPFGEEVAGSVGPRAGGAGYSQATGPRQKYAGMEVDDATGMSHTPWREFDSMSARWTAPDPYGGSMDPSSPQSFNRYGYVNNDPVNKVDPTGLMLSDIGVYQTDNAAVATRLNWAMVTVLHRYMEGQTGQAQQQQRIQRLNSSFGRGTQPSFTTYATSVDEVEEGEATGVEGGEPGEPQRGGTLGYGRVVGFNRFTVFAGCAAVVTPSGQVVSVEAMAGTDRDIITADIYFSSKITAPPKTSQTPLYGRRQGDDDIGHIIGQARGGRPIRKNFFGKTAARTEAIMKPSRAGSGRH